VVAVGDGWGMELVGESGLVPGIPTLRGVWLC